MKSKALLFWGVVSGVVGLGFYALYNTLYLFWSATGPLLHVDVRKDYFLMTGLWFVGFLMCVFSVTWLLRRFCDYKGRFLTGEGETS